ncbi:phosphatase PAP2 family protein [Hoeflea prorocentri]|uniref:Phosphatase PAP2 family protein n=1 Tax=Hoeflea prorocentri TaxID=1922333 RepID=A0A9X3ZHI9_9HYPH|nr:phosphatase PAP2 family protein [Hoeflea prorocentri]MCY6381389.1 phosphatase PAP2 family protein [Hoeflea prorocentri]MDA5399189.1 phosphatase PAP2 family protein [Hoeflea prorocentri]
MQDDYRNMSLAVVGALAVVFVLFNLFPGIDIWVSERFFDSQTRQWTAQTGFFNAYRELFNIVSIGLSVTCLILWGVALWRGPVFTVPREVWGFVPLLYILGPGLLVNAVLKNNWGRARPANVTEFGGDRTFSPPFIMSDQCERNCSFVSGEGSGAAAFFISVLVLSAYIANKTLRRTILTAAFLAAGLAAALRVFKGRHFLSDTIGAILFVSLVAVLLHWLLIGRINSQASRRGNHA